MINGCTHQWAGRRSFFLRGSGTDQSRSACQSPACMQRGGSVCLRLSLSLSQPYRFIGGKMQICRPMACDCRQCSLPPCAKRLLAPTRTQLARPLHHTSVCYMYECPLHLRVFAKCGRSLKVSRPMHPMRPCTPCAYASHVSMHPMHPCIPCVSCTHAAMRIPVQSQPCPLQTLVLISGLAAPHVADQ